MATRLTAPTGSGVVIVADERVQAFIELGYALVSAPEPAAEPADETKKEGAKRGTRTTSRRRRPASDGA